MFIKRNYINSIVVGLLIASCETSAPPSSAQVSTPSPPILKVQDSSRTLSVVAAKELAIIYPLIQHGGAHQLIEARERLAQLLTSSPSIIDYDRATVLELLGSVKARMSPPDHAGALQAFEEAIALDVLPARRTDQLLYFVGQLHFQQKHYDKSVALLEAYISTTKNTISSMVYYVLGAAYYLQDMFPEARQNLERAIEVSTEANRSYYDLLNFIYRDLELDWERRILLTKMVLLFPEHKNYSRQLAEVKKMQLMSPDERAGYDDMLSDVTVTVTISDGQNDRP